MSLKSISQGKRFHVLDADIACLVIIGWTFHIVSSSIILQKAWITLIVNKDERADSCTFCGECNIQCPQGIDIPAEMEKVFDFFHDEEYV